MIFPDYKREKELKQKGFKLIAGIDEAGRGPLAGPVVAASVILPENFKVKVRDSKTLSEKQREKLFKEIIENCLDYGVGVVDAKEIDEINIYQAAKLAMKKAILNMKSKPDYLLVDAMKIDLIIEQESIIKGDAKCNSIAAASIIAKVERDRLMASYHNDLPEYGFIRHKGYGTPEHLKALSDFGPSKIHRFSFSPVRLVAEK